VGLGIWSGFSLKTGFPSSWEVDAGEECRPTIERWSSSVLAACGVEEQLVLALFEEVLNLLLRDRPILVEDGDFVGEDAGVEVDPRATAHVSSEEDIPVPCRFHWNLQSGMLDTMKMSAAEKLTFRVVLPGLGHNLETAFPWAPSDGRREFLHGEHVPVSWKLHGCKVSLR
jgi:hypothetical protein